LRLLKICPGSVAAIRRGREGTLKSRRACPEHSEGSEERDLRYQAQTYALAASVEKRPNLRHLRGIPRLCQDDTPFTADCPTGWLSV